MQIIYIYIHTYIYVYIHIYICVYIYNIKYGGGGLKRRAPQKPCPRTYTPACPARLGLRPLARPDDRSVYVRVGLHMGVQRMGVVLYDELVYNIM